MTEGYHPDIEASIRRGETQQAVALGVAKVLAELGGSDESRQEAHLILGMITDKISTQEGLEAFLDDARVSREAEGRE